MIGLYFLLAFMVFLFVQIYIKREHLTMEELDVSNKALSKKVDEIQNDYEALNQKIDNQQNQMKGVSDKASQASTAITAAIHS
jgi:uncharacterized protein YlxW (UPF0749 family)